jgi:cell division initiation protein
MKRFTVVNEGYNMEEVNRFIDIVIKRLEKLNNENAMLQTKISSLEEKLKEEKVSEIKVTEAIMAARDTSDRIKSLAREEANMIVEEARKWEMDNIETVREYRKKRLGDDIVEGYKKTNEGVKITEEQEKAIRDQANLVAETFYTGKGIEDKRDEVLVEAPNDGVVPLSQAWTDIEGSIKLFQKTPKQL